MNLIVKNTEVQTMTSREIADLVESRHDSVKRAIVRLAQAEAISQPPLVDGEKSQNGVVEQVYLICERDSYVIVAQLSPQFTARLVDRWQELENGQASSAFQIPNTLSGALRLAAEQAEIIESQAKQIAIAAPKVEFVERYVESTSGSKGFRQVCKLLEANENEFRAFLHDRQIMYKLGGEWMPYAAHIDAGRFEVKTGTAETSGHAYNTARFTSKGVQWIAGEWAKFKLLEKA